MGDTGDRHGFAMPLVGDGGGDAPAVGAAAAGGGGGSAALSREGRGAGDAAGRSWDCMLHASAAASLAGCGAAGAGDAERLLARRGGRSVFAATQGQMHVGREQGVCWNE